MARQRDEDELRMTARVREIVPGDVEADYTIEPPEAAKADADYVRRFHRVDEARAWITDMARQQGVAADSVIWLDD
ncbi:MAG: hypothetical protein U1E45_24010 [Geminicoccaceae bacterium]